MLAVSWDTIRLFLHVLAATTTPARSTTAAIPKRYRSISRAMTSCWIWLVPS